jgi:hypothetical protein
MNLISSSGMERKWSHYIKEHVPLWRRLQQWPRVKWALCRFLVHQCRKVRDTVEHETLSRKEKLYLCFIMQHTLWGEVSLLYDWQSVCLAIEHPCGTWDITSCRNVAVWNLRSCFCWAPSLTRRRVCSRAEPVTVLCCLIWGSPTLTNGRVALASGRARSTGTFWAGGLVKAVEKITLPARNRNPIPRLSSQ